MKTYQIITSTKLEIEGELISAGSSLGTITSGISDDRLESLFDARMLSLAINVTATPQPNPTKQPVETNATPETIAETQLEPETTETETVETQANAAFPGLDTRLSVALLTQGIGTPEEIKKQIDGGLDLIDLDGIGKVAKTKIVDWLSAHLK